MEKKDFFKDSITMMKEVLRNPLHPINIKYPLGLYQHIKKVLETVQTSFENVINHESLKAINKFFSMSDEQYDLSIGFFNFFSKTFGGFTKPVADQMIDFLEKMKSLSVAKREETKNLSK